MRRYFFAMIIVVAGLIPATAQIGNESFDDFRKSINSDFQSFRKKVLDDYADFLDGIWKEYSSFRGNERDSIPKPMEQPVAPGAELPKHDPKQPTAPKSGAAPKPQTTPRKETPAVGGEQDLTLFDIPQLDFSGISGTKKDVPAKEEPKQSEPKKEEAIKKTPKQEKPQQEATKQLAPKQEMPKKSEPKQEAPTKEEPAKSEPKQEESKKDVPKQEQPKQDKASKEPRGKEPKQRPSIPDEAELKPQEEVAPTPTVPVAPLPVVPSVPVVRNTQFMYHSLVLEVPQMQWDELPAGTSPKDYAKLWKRFETLKVETNVLPIITKTAKGCKLNDWLLCECIRSYADSEMASMLPGQRMSLTHYLLAHAGFDVRIGMTSMKEPILLIALQQEIYGRSFTTLNGKKYYLFFDNLVERDAQAPLQFFTCDIPSNVDCGKLVDLLIQEEPIVPYEAHAYSFTYNGLHIEGEVNANLMPMLYRYPQMEMAYFAQSVVSERTQEDVARQIASQLESIPEHEAVDKLLKFVQSAFEYATDGEQHGFEKPYFFEEILFYPQCDCEDRSMFYSYLLKMVLGVENHLIGYPGHESVSVNLGKTISGHGYKYENKNFYISDPTYIGASTGMCMPNYVNVTPEIDFKR